MKRYAAMTALAVGYWTPFFIIPSHYEAAPLLSAAGYFVAGSCMFFFGRLWR